MALTAEEKKLWVEALRSGNYKQTKGTLHDYLSGGFCCLGLGALVLGVASKEYLGKDVPGTLEGPTDVYHWWKEKIGNTTVNLLTKMNDRGDTFAEIANWIEEKL